MSKHTHDLNKLTDLAYTDGLTVEQHFDHAWQHVKLDESDHDNFPFLDNHDLTAVYDHEENDD